MSYIQNFMEQLNNHSAVLKQQRLQHIASDIHTGQYKPLTDQIIDLMKSTPPQLLNRPWSMAELVARLDGKYRDRPHPQNVGQALRIIGWQYRRYWSKGYNGTRLWLPPAF